MNYKKRTAESTQYPNLVDYLQGGILLHFNITETNREEANGYQYNEFWFSLDSSMEYISNTVNEYGLTLIGDYQLWK